MTSIDRILKYMASGWPKKVQRIEKWFFFWPKTNSIENIPPAVYPIRIVSLKKQFSISIFAADQYISHIGWTKRIPHKIRPTKNQILVKLCGMSKLACLLCMAATGSISHSAHNPTSFFHKKNPFLSLSFAVDLSSTSIHRCELH